MGDQESVEAEAVFRDSSTISVKQYSDSKGVSKTEIKVVGTWNRDSKEELKQWVLSTLEEVKIAIRMGEYG